MHGRRAFITILLGLALILGLAIVPRIIAALDRPQVRSLQMLVYRPSVSSTRIALSPSRDNTLYEDETGSLSNGAGEHFFVGSTDMEMIRRGVIAFDVAGGIPEGSTILSATLKLNMSKSNTGVQPIALHRLLAAWGEGRSNAPDNEGAGTSATPGSATWIHTFFDSGFWTTPGGDFSSTARATRMVAGIGFYTWGSTAEMVTDVQAWLDTPATNFGWLLAGNESTATTTKRFDTRENSDPSLRPLLIIDYVAPPVPDIAVHKMASAEQARAGETITYTYQVSNTGTLLLGRVSASDDPLGAVTLGRTTLAPGERTTGTLTYTVRAADLPGPLVNSVVVSGAVSGTLSTGRVVTATAAVTVPLSSFIINLPTLQKGDPDLFLKEQLGKSIFFDDNLSINGNQSCAGCHDPEAGWTGPESDINAHGAVYEGSVAGRFGERKPPSAAYATQSPIFHVDGNGAFVGGNFWDGRATGEKLGNPAADQAQGPFLNPVEQGLSDNACVVQRVCAASYPVSFAEVYGAAVCDIAWPADVETLCATEGVTLTLSAGDRARSDTVFDNIALAIAAFEASAEVNAFTSRFDYVLKGMAQLTQEEQLGHTVFQTTGKCHKCHTDSGQQPLFTDFTFANLGIPQNPENPAGVAPAFVDPGLGGFLKSAGYPQAVYEAEWGKHKTATLRNLELRPDTGFVKAFGHNGYFKTLEGIVHFYNTRDIKPVCPGLYTEAEAIAADCWPVPEVPVNLNTQEMGDLGMTPEEEAALVAFMKALDDGYQP